MFIQNINSALHRLLLFAHLRGAFIVFKQFLFHVTHTVCFTFQLVYFLFDSYICFRPCATNNSVKYESYKNSSMYHITAFIILTYCFSRKAIQSLFKLSYQSSPSVYLKLNTLPVEIPKC